MASNLTTEPFEATGDQSTISTRWTEWIADFDIFLSAAGINDDVRRRDCLLHHGGKGLRKVYRKLNVVPRQAVQAVPANGQQPAIPAVPAETNYDAAKRVLTAHFNPKVNITYNRHIFKSAKQANEETLDEFHTRLTELAGGCNFHNVEEEIKSQIIYKCRSKKLRAEALTNPNWDLQALLEKGTAFELTKIRAQEIEEGGSSVVKKISQKKKPAFKGHDQKQQKVKPKSESQKGDCKFCGGEWHKRLEDCPARRDGVTCKQCKRAGHFARACLNPGTNKSTGSKTPVRKVKVHDSSEDDSSDLDEFANKLTVVNTATTESSDDDSDMEDVVKKTSVDGQVYPTIKLTILNKKIRLVVDSGATTIILNKSDYQKIGSPQLLTTRKRIYAYRSNKPEPILGKFKTNVTEPETKSTIKTTIYVIDDKEEESLLSYGVAIALGVMKMSEQVKDMRIRRVKLEQQPTIGKFSGLKVKLHIDPAVKPVALPHRRVPYHLRKKVEEEINKLEDLDIIEKTSGPTPWVSPIVIVPKKDSEEIRICVDMRLPNTAIKRERHVIPTTEDLLSDISGSKFFSVLDLNQAYHQVELDESSRYITTFSTHIGIYRYKRLFFGVTSAAEIFHNLIRELVSDIPGVVNASDDILIHAPTEKEHDQRIKDVIERLKSKNLTMNIKKKKIKQGKVQFFGLIIGAEGIEMDPRKVSAIQNFTRPQSVTDIRSFLGMTNWCSRFIKNHADLSEPLRRLMVKEEKFKWSKTCEQAFNKMKESLAKVEKLAHFDQHLKTTLIVDASPTGLGGILAQTDQRGKRRVVAYASKALNPTQQRYSQTEREALAIIWGCEHFRMYLLGAHFTVITDHKPLISIFNKPTSSLSARMERWMLRKQPYDFTVTYQPGADNAADYLSRHPEQGGPCKQAEVADEYVRYVSCQSVPKSLSPEEIAAETTKDKDLQEVIKGITTGKWHLSSKFAESFYQIRDELTVSEQGIVLRGVRICIPKLLQNSVINQAHQGHMGITKTKALLRTRVWFPELDKAVEDFIKNCLPCQAALPSKQREPLIMSELPDYPWQQLSLDFFSLPSGEELLVLIDDFSRFPEVEVIPTTSNKYVIPKLDRILSTFGIPEVIRTDNGPPFNGQEFKEYSQRLGFKHRKVTPKWPEANGLVERFMKTLGKVIRTAQIEKKDWKMELNAFLRNYRATPHPAMKKTPHEILMGRELQTLLPDLKRVDGNYKTKMKKYADKRRRTTPHQLAIGDKALVRKEKLILKKAESVYELNPVTIVEVKGSMITAKFENSDRVITRNSSFFKKFPNATEEAESTKLNEGEEEDEYESDLSFEEETTPEPPRNHREPHILVNAEQIIENNQAENEIENEQINQEQQRAAVHQEQPNMQQQVAAENTNQQEHAHRRISSRGNKGQAPDRYQAGSRR